MKFFGIIGAIIFLSIAVISFLFGGFSGLIILLFISPIFFSLLLLSFLAFGVSSISYEGMIQKVKDYIKKEDPYERASHTA